MPAVHGPERQGRRRRGATWTSGWVGKRILEVERLAEARLAFVTRLGDAFIPDADTVLQDGDLVHVAAAIDDLPRLERVLGSAPRPSDRTDRRQSRKSPDARRHRRSRQASAARSPASCCATATRCCSSTGTPTTPEPDSFPDADVAARRRLRDLRRSSEARLAECDVVVAATGDDKVNLVVSLLAKTEYGVPRIVARVNHPKNEWMFDESWGVDVAVSTPRCMSALVEEAVSVGDLVRLFTFRQAKARWSRSPCPANSPFAGRRVGDVTWPPDTVLVGIIREDRPDRPEPRRRPRGRTTSCSSSPTTRPRTSWRTCSPPATACRATWSDGRLSPRVTPRPQVPACPGGCGRVAVSAP